MNTKYEIYTGRFEIRGGTSKNSIGSYTEWDLFDATWNSTSPKLEAEFNTETEAREYFAGRYADYGRTWAEKGFTFWLLRGEIAWLEKNIYTDDGEYDSSDGVIDLSAEPYTNEED